MVMTDTLREMGDIEKEEDEDEEEEEEKEEEEDDDDDDSAMKVEYGGGISFANTTFSLSIVSSP